MRYLAGIPALVFAASSSAKGNEIVKPFLFSSGGVRIAGDIHSLNSRRCTALIIVGGSNVRTRGDTAVALRFFLDGQTAVVLMDRRGNGGSTGKFEVPDTKNTAWQIPRFGKDVAAVAGYLKRQGYARVVLAGTSMGGWINDSAAADAPEAIDAVVSINGGASSVGVSDKFDDFASTGMPIEEAAEKARFYRGPRGYDPALDLARISQPVMWVFGAEDKSNPSALDLANVKRLSKRGKRFTWLVLPHTDHEFINSETHDFDSSWVDPVRKFIRGSRRCG